MRSKRGNIVGRALRILAWCALALVGTALLVGRFGAICYACDALNVVSPALVVMSAAALMLACALNWRSAVARHWLALVGCGLLLVVIRAPIRQAQSCPGKSAGATLKVLEFNAWEENRTPDAAAAWILGERPDAIILVEAKLRSASLPRKLSRAYPYQVACLPVLPCSTYILSRIKPIAAYPLGEGDVENRKGLSAAAMVIRVSGQEATIVGIHLSRPMPWGRQFRELALLKAEIGRFDPRGLIVGGDFNSTPETTFVRQAAADLDVSMIPTGATWPTSAMRSWMIGLLSLDHILVGDGWGVASAAVGPTIGSDHRPTLVSLCRSQVSRDLMKR